MSTRTETPIPAPPDRMTADPLITVIVPVYGTEHLVEQALGSIFAQTFRDFEVIVVDDGTPDPVALDRVLEPYADRIRIMRQANAGVSAARNAGLACARGKYIAFLDSDDLWLPDFLAEQLSALEARPATGVVWSDCSLFGHPAYEGRSFMSLNRTRDPASLRDVLTGRCAVATSCVLARRDIVEQAGGFDPQLRCCEDYDLWLRIARIAELRPNRRVLAKHRVRVGSLASDEVRRLGWQLRVLEKHANDPGLDAPLRVIAERMREPIQARLDFEVGKRHFVEGEVAAAKRAMARANRVLKSPRIALIQLSMYLFPNTLRRAYMARRSRDISPH